MLAKIPSYLRSKKTWRHFTVRVHEDREAEFLRIANHMGVTLTTIVEFFLNWADFNPTKEWERAMMNYVRDRALRKACAIRESHKRRRCLPSVLVRSNRGKVKERLQRRRGWL